MKKMFLLMLVLCTALGTRGSVDLSDLDTALSIQSENTVTTTVTNLKTDVQNFITSNGEEKLKKLVITSGKLSQEDYEYIADIKSLELLDLTNATLPDDVRLTDPSKHKMNCQVLIFPDGTKIAPNFECFPNLKVAMGGGLKKIWLVSQKGKDDGTGGTITNAFDEVKNFIPQAIKNMDATARIGVAFVGEVTVDDVKSMVGSGAPLSNARIWHFHAAKGLTIDNFNKDNGILSFLQGDNNNPTGIVLMPGCDVEALSTDYRLGNIYSLSKDEMTLSVKIAKTKTFDIARFTTTNTRKVKIVSGTKGDWGRDNMVSLDENIINAIKGTKYAKSVDIAGMKAPVVDGEEKPFWYLLQNVKSGTVEYIRVPSTDSFDPTKYEGTTFGAIARIKEQGKDNETYETAVVYQRVPNTLYRNEKYRSDDIIGHKRIRYRGYMNMYDMKNILQDNTNEYYDLSDVKIVKYKDPNNRYISPKDFTMDMIEENTAPDMSEIKNANVKYIALPVGTELPDTTKIKQNCPKLFAIGVINDKKEPTAADAQTKDKNTILIHSWVEGSTTSVVEMLADKTDFSTAYNSKTNANAVDNAANEENVTYGTIRHAVMSGKFNHCDITDNNSSFDANGHLGTGGTLKAAFNPNSTIKSIFSAFKTVDFTNAIFPEAKDMTFSGSWGLYTNATEILLPTSKAMTEIPDECLQRLTKIQHLCIPANYQLLGKNAFTGMSGLKKITTTHSGVEGQDGNIVDRGDGTIVLSYNLKHIKTNAFSGINNMYDIYVLAEEAPICEKDAFDKGMYDGYGGFKNEHPIQRNSYINGQNGTLIYGMLHYPRVCKDNGEDKNYTDITRQYSLLDETGATNGFGELIAWPNRSNYTRSYNQATTTVEGDDTKAYTWNAWKSDDIKDGLADDFETNKDKYTYDTKYMGWHQFVLAESYYRKRAVDMTMRDYSRFKDNDWYTICVPYNITRSTLIRILGAKAGEQVTVTNAKGTTETITAGEGGLCPDVRTLVKVKRSNNNGRVTFIFSDNLATKQIDGCSVQGADVELSEDGKTYKYVEPEIVDNDPIIIKGGYPYMIKPYLPKDKYPTDGNYLVEIPKSVGKNPLGNTIEVTSGAREAATAVPYTNHKVHAIDADNSTSGETKYVYEGDDQNKPYFYHFIGTYSYKTENYMPQYSFYLGKSTPTHKFYRVNDANKVKWPRYYAIMAGRSEAEFDTSKNAQEGNIELVFTCDNDYFGADSGDTPTETKLAMSFGGDNDGTTGITEVNNDNHANNGKIYNISGKYMGMSTDGLPKGIYIMNGKKFVVK